MLKFIYSSIVWAFQLHDTLAIGDQLQNLLAFSRHKPAGRKKLTNKYFPINITTGETRLLVKQ